MQKYIYFDHSATTPIDKDVLEKMYLLQEKNFGNPSSIYKLGRESRAFIDQSRLKISKVLKCSNKEIFFTSGGSESNNWAIKGIAYANREKGNHIITSTIEHPAVLNTCKYLAQEGFEISYIDVLENGQLDMNQLEEEIREETILISIMGANNIIGSIQPIEEIGKIARKHCIYFHTDAVQLIRFQQFNLKELPVDLLSFSGHKFYGPKGVGGLYIKKGTVIDPLIHGGKQERNLRAGTENFAYQYGLALALEMSYDKMNFRKEKVNALSTYFLKRLNESSIEYRINGGLDNRLPGNLHFSLPQINQESLLLNLDLEKIYVSSGSACSSGAIEKSHVLMAIGEKNKKEADIRVSFGYKNEMQEIDEFVNKLERIVERLKG